ncbi:MAG: AAA domain-containing protein [Candidatus Eisenbacteria bacterium]|nr:AAA domain-containing protein [Candidatus Latescibacterota bacterium]MBD3302510.1 AAA domain-containing protein [Candidatus Eisenbacteria bacterium]
MHPEIRQIQEMVERESEPIRRIRHEMAQTVVGQDALVVRLLVGILADGHLLLEGVPGLAKTLSVKTLAGTLGGAFSRIQFTPDLLPADLVGTMIYDPKSAEFRTRKGPIFANVILADEINRAPAKVQSALLEAMQERQVTIGEESHPLPPLFLVLATQNPIEQEGTYPLPEAQLDRFLLKVRVDYPSREEERTILDRMTGAPLPAPQVVTDPEEILRVRGAVRMVYVDEKIRDYVLDLVAATRRPGEHGLDELAPWIAFGASPRASIYLLTAAKAHAFLEGRAYVTPDDVKALALDIFRHRILTTYEAEAQEKSPEEIALRILEAIPAP